MTLLRGDEARAVNDRILARYLTPAGIAEPGLGGAIAAGDDVTLRLDPGPWRSWSTAEDFGGLLDAPGLSLPIED